MRPGQNKRLRGRNHNRKGPNPLTRSYESNGPDVKIRGTAQHIAEKYLQLARDAQSSGDPVMAESYLQHAEHYYRVIAAAHQAQQQAMGFGGRPAPEAEAEDDEEDDVSDRFASVADRLPQPIAPNPPMGGQSFGGAPNGQMAGPPNGGGFGERQPYGGGDRQDRPHQDRPHQDRAHQDRQHNGGGERGPRPWRQDGRPDGRQDGRQDGRPDNNYERGDRPFNPGPRPEGRRFRDARADQPAPPPPEDPAAALPAFITGSRPLDAAAPAATDGEPSAAPAEVNEGQGYHLRPRRRRRGRPGGGPEGEFAEDGFAAPEGVPASE